MDAQLRPRQGSIAEIVHMTKHFSGRKVIDNISFTLGPGEVLGVIGPTGAGKSTLLKMAAGFVQPCVGCGRIFGLDVHDKAIQTRRLIGYLPEGPVGFGEMNVISFLKFISRIRGLRGAQQRLRIDEVIGHLQLDHLLYLPIATLTKSANRMVGMAQAVLHDPAVLILDGPTDGLDFNQQSRVRSLIKAHSQNTAVIVATRQLDEVTALCSRALIMANGKVCADGSPQELQSLSRYRQAVTLSTVQPLDLLALAVLPGVVGIEADQNTPGAMTILAKPGTKIFPRVLSLIEDRKWDVRSLSVENGRFDDVFRRLTGRSDE